MGFEDAVRNAKRHLMGDSMMDGMIVQAAIGEYRKALLEDPGIQLIGLSANGWMPEMIIEEETKRILDKYLSY